MEAKRGAGLLDLDTKYLQVKYSFNLLEARMEDRFMTSAILQRHPGGHSLAMPSWTIVPMLYHAPPRYDPTSRTGRMGDPSNDCDYIQEDDYGTVWTIKRAERLKHNYAMNCVKERASEGLDCMKILKYYEAVTKFDQALSLLWPCHLDTPLERWLKIHRGHALLRAGLLQNPEVHGKNISDLIQASFETFSECVDRLRPLRDVDDAAQGFNMSLLFSGLLGLAWISFFRGNMDEVERLNDEARALPLEPTHLRSYVTPRERSFMRSSQAKKMNPPVNLDTFFLQIALRQVLGSLDDIGRLFDDLGNELSKYEEDCTIAGLLETHLTCMKGEFEGPVFDAASHSFEAEDSYFYGAAQVVKEFLDRLKTGYSGNTWFAVGANQQARAAYECALGSESVLLRAAAAVGLANVFTRRNEVPEAFAEAEKMYKQALEIYNDLGFKEGQIIVYCNLGNLYHTRGQLQQALVFYTKAKTYLSETMDNGLAALHLNLKLAELHLDMDDWEHKAPDSIRRAAAIPTISNNRSARAWIEHLSGSYWLKKAMAVRPGEEQRKYLAGAKTHLHDAIKYLARTQEDVGVHTSLWLVLFEQQKETYALLLWCIALQEENPSSTIEALVWSERSRSRASMLEKWDRLFPRLREHLKDENNILDALKAIASITDAQPYEESWKHLQTLLSRSCRLLELPTVVIEFFLCADFGFLIFVMDFQNEGDPKLVRVSFKDHGLDREKLTALVDRTIFLLTPKSRDENNQEEELEANLAFLHKLLFKPVKEEWIKNTKQIIFMPHEVLCKVPFHALIDEEKKYLVERYETLYAESMRSLVHRSLLWESRHSREDEHHVLKPRKTWLVVGINKHEPGKADLRFAEQEAEEVDQLLGEGFTRTEQTRVILGSAATKKHVKPLLAGADIIHMATHGIVDAKYERGGILFKSPGAEVQVATDCDYFPIETTTTTTRSVPEFLYRLEQLRKSESLGEEVVLSAREISDMQLKAQVVVLSACQTASGVVLGEGVAGLGRALLVAQVPSTVLSLWPVSDSPTIYFMTKFYKALTQGRLVPDAMKTAMETMINAVDSYGERKYSVRHWAAFVAYGFPSVRVVPRHRFFHESLMGLAIYEGRT